MPLVIITWNANNKDRWVKVFEEPTVKSLKWDVICLQEAGNPSDDWNMMSNSPGWQPPKERAKQVAGESVIRIYDFTPPNYNKSVFIIHEEWPGRLKNHLITITQLNPLEPLPMNPCPLSDITIRPGLCLNLTVANAGKNYPLLLINVHLIASDKSKNELAELIQPIEFMCKQQKAVGWLIVGDMNCEPNSALESAESGERIMGRQTVFPPRSPQDLGCWHPGVPTHIKDNIPDHELDYIVYGLPAAVRQNLNPMCAKGDAKSDHIMQIFTINGLTLQGYVKNPHV